MQDDIKTIIKEKGFQIMQSIHMIQDRVFCNVTTEGHIP
jgi:hypothetical protein